ncbi:uncharacterized protein LOC144142504 [Haemaphysalis longicornis]
MHGKVVLTCCLVGLIVHASSQTTPKFGTHQAGTEARDLAPQNVFVLTKTDICLHSLGIDPANVKANVFWKAPRIVESPIVAYAIHVITETGYDITIRVDSTITEYPVDIFQCWEVYMVRVEAVFESGESAVSAATVVHVTDESAPFLPQGLSYIESRRLCKLSTCGSDSIQLSWRRPQVGRYNVTGYAVTVSTTLGKREFYSLAPADTTFLYDNLSSNATTSFGVSARTILDVGPTAHSHVNFTFPPAYVTWSRENKAYIIPAPKTTTHLSEKTHASPEYHFTTTKISSKATKSYTTASEAYRSTTPPTIDVSTHGIDATTSFDNVQPVASGVSTTTILCSVLIPLALIVLAILAFFGYKKYKQAGSQGLLSNSDDP